MYCENLLELNNAHIQIGDWVFTNKETTMWLVVPSKIDRSGKVTIRLPIAKANERDKHPEKGTVPIWDWDGSIDAPTLSPSINVYEHWHGFLQSGKLVTA